MVGQVASQPLATHRPVSSMSGRVCSILLRQGRNLSQHPCIFHGVSAAAHLNSAWSCSSQTGGPRPWRSPPTCHCTHPSTNGSTCPTSGLSTSTSQQQQQQQQQQSDSSPTSSGDWSQPATSSSDTHDPPAGAVAAAAAGPSSSPNGHGEAAGSSSSSSTSVRGNGGGNGHLPQRHTSATKGYGSHPPPRRGCVPEWTEDPLPPLPRLPVQRRIFCNRALNMKQIKAIGYDMDYTLAQYTPDTFEALAHKETVAKLVDVFRYPAELRKLDFQWDYMTKGLIIDKERGNMLKVDRHNYVKVAYHGFQELPADVRKSMYTGRTAAVFDEAGFAMVDTLFSLAEAYLFMQLVEMKDQDRHDVLARKSYKDLYRDLRTAVDMCHRDGSLKRAVATNPERFIHRDEHLVHILETQRASGRSLFLATNSLFDYTNVVMNFLIDGKTGASKTYDWLRYFDVVMVGCAKPAFFQHRAPLFSVDVNTGMLKNTDNGAPIIPIDEQDMADGGGMAGGSPVAVAVGEGLRRGGGGGNVYQGGWYLDLHKLLRVTEGSQVLYVGDHIYGDIVTSKKDVGWRTMLVVPELELELDKLARSSKMQEELRQLRQLRDEYDDRIQRLKWSTARAGVSEEDQSYKDALQLLEAAVGDRAQLKSRHSALLRSHHRQFHPIWGQLMKTGHQNSRFAHQVERYACLYTSHVANLAFVSPDKSYMGRMDLMAHEWDGQAGAEGLGGLGGL